MDTNTNSPMAKKSLWMIIVGIIALIAIIILAVYSYRNRADQPGVNQGANQALTEEQKTAILKQLAESSANTTPLTEKQKTDILKQLSAQSSQTKPLTDAQKAEILKSLQVKQ